ncbi:MAG: tetratricopeptide repeat protein [Candidatus Omnitrophica bacterium]|jgi:Flp pilus assembly protein TadD|nr:tetratricopeptide repeat protein [Candidatus Omnitrophota bacterium]MDD5660692.1 tetratricopeptide repeat protein [Candidatus Omnitrophota bacterium]
MNRDILPKYLIIIATILCVFCFADSLFAKGAPVKPKAAEDHPYTLESQAHKYREEGARHQAIGNLSEAKGWYQKAVALDPNYAVAYNDLGVIYEAQGDLDKAEENYLRAIKIDPAYLSAYTNLAFFYENKRNLKKAEFYWAKRSALGSPDDPWALKAANRLKDIRSVLSDSVFADQREEEVLDLMEDVTVRKSTFKEDKEQARDYFKKARQSFNDGDLALAIKLALDAQQLEPDNEEIEAFIEKAGLRALSR